ncbi:MAG TPA: ATP-binding cassette domain-containing protein [Candidatus Acidoferrum sp.]|nr:ATP-binding cassette domain-containing protein [Candidatus Acidoferrum sp.]
MIAEALRVRRGRFTLRLERFAADASGTAVLGPNGSGKTTLLLALQGLLRAEGTLVRPNESAAVFARPAVLRGSALWNLVVIAAEVLRLDRAAASMRARRILDAVGLHDAAQTDARSLSTGQRARLALGRALVVEPKALFLDEPFANVDADGRPALRALVRDYVERSGCALVIATSTLADALTLCAKASVLRGGRLVHEGPTRELTAAHDPYVRALVAEGASL